MAGKFFTHENDQNSISSRLISILFFCYFRMEISKKILIVFFRYRVCSNETWPNWGGDFKAGAEAILKTLNLEPGQFQKVTRLPVTFTEANLPRLLGTYCLAPRGLYLSCYLLFFHRFITWLCYSLNFIRIFYTHF